MSDKQTELNLPAAAAERLIAAHDGDVALLYLYQLRFGALDTEAAAGVLCRTSREIEAAAEKLARMGLSAFPAGREPERLLPPEDRLPELSSAEVLRLAESSPLLQVIFGEAARVFGRKLSSADMKMLAGIHQHLGMPAEVILLLLNYCAESAGERKPGSVPSPRSIEKEAYLWANREILTLEQAEDYIRMRREQRTQTAQIRELLNIRDRPLAKSEREYVESWLSLGFGPEAVAIAYDRTVTNTGSLRWPYMNKILLSWHEKKLHTAEEIAAQDGARRAAGAKDRAGGSRVDLRELDEIYEKI